MYSNRKKSPINIKIIMNRLDKNLVIIEQCIKNDQYQEVKTDRFEVKNLSNGWGNDFYKSVCAFLNTKGGKPDFKINENLLQQTIFD